MPPPSGSSQSVWNQVAFYVSLGFIVPGAAVAGGAIGRWLDGLLHTSPALMVVLALAGAAGGIVELLRILSQREKREARDDSSPGPGAGSGQS